jgi:transposase InsO family protein
VVHTDYITASRDEIIDEFLRITGVEQSLITAYSSEENGIVERENKEVLRHLNAILFDSRVHDRWSFEQLPTVQQIINTVEKTSNWLTPAQLILNNSFDFKSKYCRVRQGVLPPEPHG